MPDDRDKDKASDANKPSQQRDQVNDLPQTGTSKEGAEQVKGGKRFDGPNGGRT